MFSRITALTVVLLLAATVIAAPAEAGSKRPWVTVKASSSTVTVGSAVTFSGKVGRHAPRQRLRLQRASGSRWVTVSTRTLPRASKTRSHRFRVTVKQAGRQRFRVLLAKKGKVHAVASRPVAVTGRRPVPPKPTPSPTPPTPTPPAPRLQEVPGGTGVDGIGISANGRWVVYRKIRAVGDGAMSDVFLVDMVTGSTVQVTKAASGDEADAGSFQSSVSDDGNWVAYSSEATNLVLGDTNATRDVFLWSRATRTTTLVSRGADGAPADNWSQGPDVSGDGSVVVFSSNADNLAPGSTPKLEELFAWHRDTGATTRLSDGESGPLGNSFNSLGVSADGSTAVFESRTTYERTIYLRSLSNGELTRVREGRRPVVSADGRHVAYLGSGSWGDVVETWDAVTDTTTRVSVRLDGQDPRDMVAKLSISADGRWITFLTSDQVTEDDGNGRRDAYLWDRTTGRATLVSSPTDRKPATEEARDAVVSGDGAYVIFQSQEPFAVVGKPEALYRWARTYGS